MISFSDAVVARGLPPQCSVRDLSFNLQNGLPFSNLDVREIRKHSTLLTASKSIALRSLQEQLVPKAGHDLNGISGVAFVSAVDVAEPALSLSITRGTELAERPLDRREDREDKVKISPEPDDAQGKLSKIWRKIQGEDNWKDLLGHSINPILRSEIIRYGEFAQICYDAFDFDRHSIYCGSCKYNRAKLLEKMGKGDSGYEVTKYLFATSDLELPKFFRRSDREAERWSGDSNWMGYVAVARDEKEVKRLGRRDIMVAWRGTVTATEWVDDLWDVQEAAGLEKGREDVKVEAGFRSLYVSSKAKSRFNRESAREQVRSEVGRLLREFEGEEVSVTVTGHSLGGALAVLSAYDIAAAAEGIAGTEAIAGDEGRRGRRRKVPVTVFSFSAPRVGNLAFKRRVAELGVAALRVVNCHDGVPKVPGIVFNEGSPAVIHRLADRWAYHHVGVALQLDAHASPLLRRITDPASHHNLEALLHLLDGFHGPGAGFASATNRCPALVNKASDFLRPDVFIPPFWWQERNKGLVKSAQGQWIVRPRDEEHLPENH